MEAHASVSSLVIVLLAAFLTPILLHRFKLNIIPVVVAEIIVGLIIGESGLQLVHPDMWLETLSLLGFIFLMFLSGVEIDFSAFVGGKKKEKNAPNSFVVATVYFIGIFILSYALALLFVWAGFIDNAFLMTLIISTISLGVVVPTLKEAQIMKTNIGQTILLVAVISDLVTMVLLAVFVSMYSDGQGNTWLLLILFGAGVLLYFLGKYFRNQSYLETMTKGTIQIDTRAVFTLIILLVAVSESIGAENILGAFLAGVLVSLLSPNPEMVHKLDSFGYGFLIPIFFVMIGVELDIWALFSDPKTLLLIPLLLIGLFISKIVPALLLSKWFDWKTIFSSAFLLTSTLSLVIAAAKIGERIEVLTAQESGALILVAVISCIISPILFRKLFPKHHTAVQKFKVVFIGANQMTLPISRELDSDYYEPYIFHVKQEKINGHVSNPVFHIVEVENYSIEALEKQEVFNADILVLFTGDENINSDIAIYAKEHYGIERVIARAESPSVEKELRNHDIDVFSVFFSTKTLLKAFIETPSILNILTKEESALFEIDMNNSRYEGVLLRNFPFTGDVIIVRVFRGLDSIVPHGDTELMLYDRLIVTGSKEYVDDLRMLLEYGK
ncbi:monovalent cation:proton antiporter family protein [Schinkia azotoformans]|uniref:monovalent cation:proton antiporter family protein n=1 Tax=Schinkia azotoformans TaxID=1454 RepID=UPI0005509398|nr:monovalent cation:proton antiporter family protein [Schinkia azotoformans]MEC1694108.1 monovalent cation:proton antiporter family protein [Schinkia azotoformans]MEC1715820.1 monovalent cation:proton antiporter family protein [Schinkia azotoformans]MEC1724887.1 monovalent cation:proton antiporter family protein [Schinkia azotoformans]MEC1741459.1 monovalent cation:proton antiporter family protein [Schinkia azotoformans]MEC1744453.1 monovalent cation:proton antiporter family protein [Schinkia